LFPVPTFGLVASDQLVPFHDSARVCETLPALVEPPAALHEVAEMQETEFSTEPLAPAVGWGLIVHDVPFHDSMRASKSVPS